MKSHPDYPGVPANDPFPHTHPNAMRVETASNAELDEIIVRRDAHGAGFPFQTLDEIMRAPEIGKDWLIKGLVAAGETSAWIAPPGGMKSALMAELSFCVAFGEDWH